MSKNDKERKRGGHFVLVPGLLSEAVIEGLARQRARQIVKVQDEAAVPKMPQKIGEVDSRLEN